MSFTAAVLMCLVVHVSDGDSLFARCHESDSTASWPTRIRIAEIDAPEFKQNFGREAKSHLETLCLGQTAEITPVTRDQYDAAIEAVDANRFEPVIRPASFSLAEYNKDMAGTKAALMEALNGR